jgi:hypothetical protein
LRRRTARSGLDIIMVNICESVNAAKEASDFAAVWGLDGTILLDETGEYAAKLGIRGVPFNLAVDSSGLVRAAGISTPDELEQAVETLMDRH